MLWRFRRPGPVVAPIEVLERLTLMLARPALVLGARPPRVDWVRLALLALVVLPWLPGPVCSALATCPACV